MDLPSAIVSHRLSNRVRLKIRSRRGDRDYFSAVAEKLAGHQGVERLEANPGTGSVLVIGKDLDPSAIAGYAETNGLFSLNVTPAQRPPLSGRLVAPIGRLSDSLDRFTHGEVDLPGLVFLGLLGTGIYQLARGNFRSPPWYTAFWYAMGVFTKLMVDKKTGDPGA